MVSNVYFGLSIYYTQVVRIASLIYNSDGTLYGPRTTRFYSSQTSKSLREIMKRLSTGYVTKTYPICTPSEPALIAIVKYSFLENQVSDI